MRQGARSRDRLDFAFLGPFALAPKSTVRERLIPLARALMGRGHRARIVVPPYDHPADSGMRRIVRGVPVENLYVTGALTRDLASLPVQAVGRALSPPPDVILGSKSTGVAGAAMLLLRLWRAFGRRPKLILDLDDAEGSTGATGRLGHAPQVQLLADLGELVVPHAADGITTCSRYLQRGLGDRGFDDRRVRYLPNGVDGDDLPGGGELPADVARLIGGGAGPVVGFYTRFREVSGLRLSRVATAIAARLPEAKILLIGAGPAGEELEVAGHMADRGLAGRFLGVGFVPRPRLGAYLRAADLFVFPFDETPVAMARSPVRVLQAMALGRPVVAEAVGELTEMVGGWGTGAAVLSGPGAEAGLVEGVVQGLARREELGSAARELVARTHSWESRALDLEELLRALDR